MIHLQSRSFLRNESFCKHHFDKAGTPPRFAEVAPIESLEVEQERWSIIL